MAKLCFNNKQFNYEQLNEGKKSIKQKITFDKSVIEHTNQNVKIEGSDKSTMVLAYLYMGKPVILAGLQKCIEVLGDKDSVEIECGMYNKHSLSSFEIKATPAVIEEPQPRYNSYDNRYGYDNRRPYNNRDGYRRNNF